MICGHKELKKIANVSGQLDTVRRIICMDDEFQSDASLVSLVSGSSGWTVTSFLDVEKLGRESPVDPELPLSADIAVIMYTSGSTGMPKVSMCVRLLLFEQHNKFDVCNWFRAFVIAHPPVICFHELHL